MPRQLQNKIHPSFSKSIPDWQFFRDSIKRLFDASSNRADFGNHVVREHNRKVAKLNLPINLLIPNCDSSGRLKSNAIDAIEKTLKTANSTAFAFYFATYDSTSASARSLSFSTSSGYWRMIYENGTYGTVTASGASHATAIPAGSGYRIFGVMVCDASGNPIADYEFNSSITITNCNLVYFSYQNFFDGNLINLSNNLLTNIDLNTIDSPNLAYVNLSNNLLSYIKLNTTYVYNSISLSYNKFTSFDGAGINTNSIDLSNNPLTSIIVNGLSASDDALNLSNTNLTSFDSTGFTGSLNISNCANLTSVKLIGTSGYACYINNNPNLTSFIANGGGFSEFSISSNSLGTVSITSFSATIANFTSNLLTSFSVTNSNFDELYLGNNLLTYVNIPSSISTYCSLTNNKFTTFNNIIIPLCNNIDLSYNYLSSFVGCTLSGLGTLNLSHNQFVSVNTSMGTLPLDTILDLSYNPLTTFAPLNSWRTTYLYLNNCQLTNYSGQGMNVTFSDIGFDFRNNSLSLSSVNAIITIADTSTCDIGYVYLDGGTNTHPTVTPTNGNITYTYN
jgi:hypothetical protein